MPDRMPDRLATAPVLEYMSDRVPEAKALSNRLSGDCSKQNYAVRIETRPDSEWLSECMAENG